MKGVVSEVVEKLSSAQSLKYSEILALDRKISSFGTDDAISQSAMLLSQDAAGGGIMSYLQRYADLTIKGNSE